MMMIAVKRLKNVLYMENWACHSLPLHVLRCDL